MSDVKLLRLTSGEEIMGEVDHKLEELIHGLAEPVYTITDPAVLRWVPREDDPKVPRLVIASLIPHSDETSVTIHERHVLFEIAPVEELISEYNSVRSSGIAKPNKEVA